MENKHCRPRTIPVHHTVLLPQSGRSDDAVRRDQRALIRQRAPVDAIDPRLARQGVAHGSVRNEIRSATSIPTPGTQLCPGPSSGSNGRRIARPVRRNQRQERNQCL